MVALIPHYEFDRAELAEQLRRNMSTEIAGGKCEYINSYPGKYIYIYIYAPWKTTQDHFPPHWIPIAFNRRYSSQAGAL